MKDFLIFFAFIAIWFLAWKYTIRQSALLSYHAVLRHIVGISIGCFPAIVFLIVAIQIFPPNTENKVKDETPDATTVHKNASSNAVASTTSSIDGGSDSSAKIANKTAVTLDLTPKQYAQRFDKFMEEMDLPFRAKLSIMKGESSDSFKFLINDNIFIIGRIDQKSGNIKDSTLMGRGDGSVESGANIVMVAVAALAAGTPGGSVKNVGPEVGSLIQGSDKKKGDSEEGTSRIFNGVKLYHMSSEQMGTWFGVEAIE